MQRRNQSIQCIPLHRKTLSFRSFLHGFRLKRLSRTKGEAKKWTEKNQSRAVTNEPEFMLAANASIIGQTCIFSMTHGAIECDAIMCSFATATTAYDTHRLVSIIQFLVVISFIMSNRIIIAFASPSLSSIVLFSTERRNKLSHSTAQCSAKQLLFKSFHNARILFKGLLPGV